LNVGRFRTDVRIFWHLVSLRFYVGSLFDQDGGEPFVFGGLGKLQERRDLTRNISSTEHDKVSVE